MKKFLIVGLIVSLLLVGVVAPASAVWTDEEVVTVTGHTGSVSLSLDYVNVTLPGWIYPGYKGDFAVEVTNDGKLDVYLTITHSTLPVWLTIAGPSFGTQFLLTAGQVRIFNFTVEMPSDKTGVQNTTVTFTITFKVENK